jgi:hypothetical protein
MDAMAHKYRDDFRQRPSYDGRKNLFSLVNIGPYKEVHNWLCALAHLNTFSSAKLLYIARNGQSICN